MGTRRNTAETSALVASVGLAAGAGLILVLVRGRAPSLAELAIYGLGSVAPLALAAAILQWG